MESSSKERGKGKMDDLLKLSDFPGEKEDTLQFGRMITVFLNKYASVENYPGFEKVWLISLSHNDSPISMYVVPESSKDICYFCRAAGWSHHFVTKTSYRFIIPKDGGEKNNVDSLNEVPQILYALVHCNGYGHLLSYTGREDGSLLTEEVMGLWDRICIYLSTRKVSVKDTSIMLDDIPSRLIQTVAYGRPWCGSWGYKFGKGSFGVTSYDYAAGVKVLREIELEQLLALMDKAATDLAIGDPGEFISRYKSINSLIKNLGDLSLLMLGQISPDLSSSGGAGTSSMAGALQVKKAVAVQKPKPEHRDFITVAEVEAVKMGKPLQKVIDAGNAIATELKKGQTMTRKMLKDAVNIAHTVDKVTLDRVLGFLDNIKIGDSIIERYQNRERLLEFTIRELDHESADTETVVPKLDNLDLKSDLKNLYDLLMNFSKSKMITLAVQIILNTKIFMKEWPYPQPPKEYFVCLLCRVIPTVYNNNNGLQETYAFKREPPLEPIVVSVNSAHDELKHVFQDVMQHTYHIMDSISLPGLEGVSQEDSLLPHKFESGSVVTFRASGIQVSDSKMYQGEKLDVDCKCGSDDFDCEIMVACEKCKAWRHKPCNYVEFGGIDITCKVCEIIEESMDLEVGSM